MTKYLLQVAIGPVQDFIAAARRTRDLWCGSLILSEISKAAARELANAGAQLVFPALSKGDPELDAYPQSEFNVANIILAEVPPEIAIRPEELTARAEAAAQKCWLEISGDVRHEAGGFIVRSRWDNQLADVIEFYAAWCPLNEQSYRESRSRLRQLADGRKACRDFMPANGDHGIPKSSLDGARETVLIREDRRPELSRSIRSRLRLAGGEQLDAVGLTKRLGFGIQPYPSVSRIAVDPWVRGLAKSNRLHAQWQSILDMFEDLCAEDALFRIGRFAQYSTFPYEGAALYRNRHHQILQDAQGDASVDRLLEKLHKALTKLKPAFGEPDPYLGVLVADGDDMGRWISQIDSLDTHRNFSKELAGFASRARDVVEKWHGCLVYSGGDDVLALLPLDTCLECAHELQALFGDLLRDFSDTNQSPTLSVGIAVGHCMEPLEDLLGYGRKAEQAAKRPDKNGLAVHIHTRGGGPVKIRGRWNAKVYERLVKWIDRHRENRISDTAAYDLKLLADDYTDWRISREETEAAIKADVKFLFKRKRPGGREIDPEDIDTITDDLFATLREREGQTDLSREVHQLAAELIVTRMLAQAKRQSAGIDLEAERTGS